MKRTIIKGKGHRKLPNRGAMNDLKQSGGQLTDYSKASPLVSDEDPASVLTAFMPPGGKKR
jgi:hypothetical protein